jgi:hypothetical protein
VSDIKYQIFVSSTFEDLQDERRSVFEAILNSGHIPVGMELFQAGNDDQWSYIKRRIQECDYYFVIVAERYGAIGPGGKSYTQMEYEFAVEKGIPVAAFILHESARRSWPKSKIEFDKEDNLDSFKSLCKQKMSQFWSNCDNLAMKVAYTIKDISELSPRIGWVRANAIPSPQLLNNYDHLYSENTKLKADLEKIRSDKNKSKKYEKLIDVTTGFILKEINNDKFDIKAKAEGCLVNYSIIKFLEDNYNAFLGGVFRGAVPVLLKAALASEGGIMTITEVKRSFSDPDHYLLTLISEKFIDYLLLFDLIELKEMSNSRKLYLSPEGRALINKLKFDNPLG